MKNNPEQILSKYLLACCVTVMLICFILRICGPYLIAESADIRPASRFIKEFIKALLMIFELCFIYKILLRSGWYKCIGLSILVTVIGILVGYIGSVYISNIYYMLCVIVLPFVLKRKLIVLIESGLLYVVSFIYGITFLIGRIETPETNAAYDYAVGILSTIDYKLFIVSIYLFLKSKGGITLWKKKKIFQM